MCEAVSMYCGMWALEGGEGGLPVTSRVMVAVAVVAVRLVKDRWEASNFLPRLAFFFGLS